MDYKYEDPDELGAVVELEASDIAQYAAETLGLSVADAYGAMDDDVHGAEGEPEAAGHSMRAVLLLAYRVRMRIRVLRGDEWVALSGRSPGELLHALNLYDLFSLRNNWVAAARAAERSEGSQAGARALRTAQAAEILLVTAFEHLLRADADFMDARMIGADANYCRYVRSMVVRGQETTARVLAAMLPPADVIRRMNSGDTGWVPDDDDGEEDIFDVLAEFSADFFFATVMVLRRALSPGDWVSLLSSEAAGNIMLYASFLGAGEFNEAAAVAEEARRERAAERSEFSLGFSVDAFLEALEYACGSTEGEDTDELAEAVRQRMRAMSMEKARAETGVMRSIYQ